MEFLLFFIPVIIGLLYVFMLFWILSAFNDIEEWMVPEDYECNTKVSVIVAARNEEQYIRECLLSIFACDYPSHLLEVIVVDDQSTDHTAEIVREFPDVKYLKLTDSTGKKAALHQGIMAASGTLIFCTDADCVVPEKWLKLAVSLYEINKPKVISGPIAYQCHFDLKERFQFLDAAANLGIGAAGIATNSYYMANGANLIYEKALYEEIGGFAGNQRLASGDDMFLVQSAAKKHHSKIRFLKSSEAVVLTQPVRTWKGLLQQRKRWATKSGAYPDKNITKIQAFVLFVNLLIVTLLLLAPLTHGLTLFSAAFLLLIKWSIDYLFLSRMADFIGTRRPLNSFLTCAVLFMVYIFTAAFFAIFPSKYEWKNRKVR